MTQISSQIAPPTFPKVRYFFFLDLLTLFLGIGFLTGIVTGIFNVTLDETNPYFLEGSYCLIMGLWTWTTANRLRQKDIDLHDLLGSFQIRRLPWLVILIVLYADANLSVGITNLNLFFTHLISPEAVDTVVETLDIPLVYDWSLVLSFVAIVLVAPITEEFIFRGALLHRWATKWSVLAGIIASSVLFGLIHFDFFIPERIVSGVIYSLMYFKTQTLLVPIILHFGNNFLAFFGHLIHDLAAKASSEPVTIAYLWYGLVQIVLAIPGLLYFLKLPNDSRLLPYFTNSQPHPNRH